MDALEAVKKRTIDCLSDPVSLPLEQHRFNLSATRFGGTLR